PQHVFLEYFREKPARIDVANWRDQLDVSNLGCCYLHVGLVPVNLSKFVYTIPPKKKRMLIGCASNRAEINRGLTNWRIGPDAIRIKQRLRGGCRHDAILPHIRLSVVARDAQPR